jgi:hypothetical protein
MMTHSHRQIRTLVGWWSWWVCAATAIMRPGATNGSHLADGFPDHIGFPAARTRS